MARTRYARLRVLRRSRALMGSSRHWRARLVFWIGAIAIGVISAAFAHVSDLAQQVFHSVTTGGWHTYVPLVLTPLSFVVLALATDLWFQGAQGSGIPQVIAARHLHEDEDRGGYLTMKVVIGKVIMTIIALGCGASIGREGPTVQIGAAVMLKAAKIGRLVHARGLILAGSAAGIAAAFNTPLAGIVFAIEEMSRSYQARTNGIVLSTVIISGIASLALVGNYTYFGTYHGMAAEFPGDWPLVIVCGVLGGALGAAFSGGVLWITRTLRRWRAVVPRWKVVLVAFCGGMLVALTGLITHGETFGTGYDQARGAIEGQHLPLYFFLAKFIATIASTLSGIPGGLFAPSLAVGAGLGSSIGMILGSSIGLAAVLGMAGYFAGVVQAPMTAFVIIVEMTDNNANLVPIMAASMIGYGVSRMLSPEPLYHGLSRYFTADAIRKKRANQAQPNGEQVALS